MSTSKPCLGLDGEYGGEGSGQPHLSVARISYWKMLYWGRGSWELLNCYSECFENGMAKGDLGGP